MKARHELFGYSPLFGFSAHWEAGRVSSKAQRSDVRRDKKQRETLPLLFAIYVT